MDTNEQEAYRKQYDAKLDEMDAEAKQWETNQRAQYEDTSVIISVVSLTLGETTQKVGGRNLQQMLTKPGMA